MLHNLRPQQSSKSMRLPCGVDGLWSGARCDSSPNSRSKLMLSAREHHAVWLRPRGSQGRLNQPSAAGGWRENPRKYAPTEIHATLGSLKIARRCRVQFLALDEQNLWDPCISCIVCCMPWSHCCLAKLCQQPASGQFATCQCATGATGSVHLCTRQDSCRDALWHPLGANARLCGNPAPAACSVHLVAL